MLPAIDIKWKGVALGAGISGFVFTVLNSLFGWYLRTFPATSLADTAAALALLMVWVFVTAEFLLYGALTKTDSTKLQNMVLFRKRQSRYPKQQLS
jgi:uncharacterized BrkB/YihY/UPF0761 family membrane protein